MVAKGSVANRNQIAARRISTIENIVSSGSRVSAREIQRRIGGRGFLNKNLEC